MFITGYQILIPFNIELNRKYSCLCKFENYPLPILLCVNRKSIKLLRTLQFVEAHFYSTFHIFREKNLILFIKNNN